MNATIRDAIIIRPLLPGDRSFVLDTFRRDLLEDATALDSLNHRPVRPHVEAIDRAMRGLGDFAVAVLLSDPSRIVGWAGARDGELLFAYVRSAFRRWGIAGQLVTSILDVSPIPLVYWTRHAERLRTERGYPIRWAWETCQRIQNQRPRRMDENQARSLHAV